MLRYTLKKPFKTNKIPVFYEIFSILETYLLLPRRTSPSSDRANADGSGTLVTGVLEPLTSSACRLSIPIRL